MVDTLPKLRIEPCTCVFTCNKFFVEPILMIDSRMDKEDARRIVASWNYLRSISLEDLEKALEIKGSNTLEDLEITL